MEITQVNDLTLDLALFYARHGLGTRHFPTPSPFSQSIFLDLIEREPSLSSHCPTPSPTLLPSSFSLALPRIPPETSTICLISKKTLQVQFRIRTSFNICERLNIEIQLKLSKRIFIYLFIYLSEHIRKRVYFLL